MIKSDLVQRMADQNWHLLRRDVDNIVNVALGEIITALKGGARAELRGFGVFSVKHRLAHTGRNPLTGVPVALGKQSVPYFKTAKEMRQRRGRRKGDEGSNGSETGMTGGRLK
jgi:integration host factor subunit beta